MNVAILTSPEQWFVPHAKLLLDKIPKSKLFFRHEEISEKHDIVFILSYHRIIEKCELDKHQHNIVVHASALPLGKGWAPLFWQVLEGKDSIPFSLFEATQKMDAGDIYMQKHLSLTGFELNDELRASQATLIQQMCIEFIDNYEKYKKPTPQVAKVESIYPRRTAKDSQLDLDKTLREQFNLLRIVNNDLYPAFFELDGYRYNLRIDIDEIQGGGQLIDFVDLSAEEKTMILSWRNHESIRKWMYQSKPISLSEHHNFINSLVQNTTKQYLVLKTQQGYLGVIDFLNIDYKHKVCKFGLYANPDVLVAEVGGVLQKASIIYAFEILNLKTLKLEVFSNNMRAINLYKKFKFKVTGHKMINQQKVLCMQLHSKF